ncbi:MAG: hypothetical protein IKO37_07595, partial [Prevotella sp.]|nr:hypothetical protein [Prevotella sp.]
FLSKNLHLSFIYSIFATSLFAISELSKSFVWVGASCINPFFMPFQGVFHAVMKGFRLKKVNNQLHFCCKIIVFQRKVVPLQPLPRDGSIKFKPNLN